MSAKQYLCLASFYAYRLYEIECVLCTRDVPVYGNNDPYRPYRIRRAQRRSLRRIPLDDCGDTLIKHHQVERVEQDSCLEGGGAEDTLSICSKLIPSRYLEDNFWGFGGQGEVVSLWRMLTH